MALQHLRSSTANKRPTPAAMSDGQLALNTNLVSPGLFFKDSNGDSVKVGPVHVGTTAPNATPGAGGQAGNSKGEQWLDTSSSRYVFKIWDGTAWRTEDGEFVNVSGDTMTGALGIIAGTAAAPGVFFTGDLNTGIFSPGADQVAVATNGTSRLHISSAGLVGIGTSTPSEILDAYGSIRFGAANVGRIYSTEGTRGSIQISAPHDSTNRAVSYGNNYYIDSSGTWTQASSAIGGSAIELRATSNNYGEIIFRQKQDGDLGGAERIPLVITGAGNVGIGITSPTEGLHTAGPPLFEHNSSAALYIKKTTTGTESRILFSNTADTKAAQMRINWAAQTFGAFEAWVPANASNGQSIAFEAGRDSTIFYTSSTERARIDSSGRLLIGTSSSFNSDLVQIENNSGNNFSVRRNTAAQTAPANIALSRSRGATNTSFTALASNDWIGQIRFNGADGTADIAAASISAYVDGTPGANDMPGRLVFSTTADGASTPTERLRITSAGLVGIGTSAPVNLLHVQGDATFDANTGGQFAIRGSTDSQNRFNFGFETTNNYAWIQAITAGTAFRPIALNPSGGNVGIGTTSPTAQLDIEGTGSVNLLELTSTGNSVARLTSSNTSLCVLQFGDPDDTYVGGLSYDNSTDSLALVANNSERARIDSSGRLLVGTSTADTTHYASVGKLFVEGTGDAPSSLVQTCWNASDTSQAHHILAKSGGASVGTRGIVASGELLGTVAFEGDDGTNFIRAAQIRADVDGTPGTNDMPGRLVFSTTADGASSPTERMRIDSSANIYFNTTATPNTTSFGTRISTVLAHSRNTPTAAVAQFFGSAGECRILGNGNVQNTNNSYGAISDINLKEKIVDASSQWDDIKALKVRNYNLKEGSTHTQIGVIAQEVELVSPGLVAEYVDENTDGSIKCVNYSVLYMKAVKALQEAMERIEQLEQRLTDAGIA